ncbi:hypothetical protein AX17_005803 [Amanita inopinata Kibby_2008]|nr:hypothetical protein AX17_005803 [Amanita inopinata Kibby_2008]
MSTSQKNTSERRLTRVYVDIPPSPHNLSMYSPVPGSRSRQPAHASTKENGMLSATRDSIVPTQATLKRKTYDHALRISNSSMKKPKLDVAKVLQREDGDALQEEISDEFIYCHQCFEKQDPTAIIQCTAITHMSTGKRTSTVGRCSAKYCQKCLNKCYGEDVDKIKAKKSLRNAYKCPKCRRICNCIRCKKVDTDFRPGATSAARTLANKVQIDGVLPDKLCQVEKKVKTISMCNGPRPSKCPKPSPPAPLPKWMRLHSILRLPEAEERIHIREFMLRFAKIMEPALNKSCLEELELIGGGFRGREVFDDMASWVSESCIKSMILGLLSLIVDEYDDSKAVRASMKELRFAGSNLGKIWNVLEALRKDATNLGVNPSRNERILLTFPDPLPPPASAIVRQTRSMRGAGDALHRVRVTCSGQMLPVITALVELATDSSTVREEIERGIREAKDLVRKGKEAIRVENERWEKFRRDTEINSRDLNKKHASRQDKIPRDAHRRRLLDIDKAIEVVLTGYTPRFKGLLGMDVEGRKYWTISPGVEETTAALKFTSKLLPMDSCEEFGNKQRKAGESTFKAQSRGDVKEWSWCLVVWGHRPSNHSTDDSETENDNDDEKWWVFREPEEIKMLAAWLEQSRHVNNSDGSPASVGDDEALSKRLIKFADFLEWRCEMDWYKQTN